MTKLEEVYYLGYFDWHDLPFNPRSLQKISIQNLFSTLGHWQHKWCSQYCGYVTLPVDLILIIASVISKNYQKRLAEMAVAITLLVGLLMFLLP